MTKIPRSLEEGLRDGRVIPFVGAGVSMAVERVGGGRVFPSWRQLLVDGAARLEREGKKADLVRALVNEEPPDYLEAAQRLRDKLGPLWGDFLKNAIDVSRAEHLHGHIDNASGLILTPDGYASLYPAAGETPPRHEAALETLRHLLTVRSFLFVGFSLDDEHLGVELLDIFERFGGPHYALVHRRDVERLRRLLCQLRQHRSLN